MAHPLTPREKVRQIIDGALNSAIPEPWEIANHATDAILTVLASGSGDHAELARLAEAATRGPWVCKEGSTSYPECDDKDFWSVVLSPAGKEIVTLHERYASKSDDRGDYDFDAAFIAAANPATVLSLLAENAALRAEQIFLVEQKEGAEDALFNALSQSTEAERKLAEAVGLLTDAADELASEVEHRYEHVKDHPAMTPKYDRDMDTVTRIRTFLSKEAERDRV